MRLGNIRPLSETDSYRVPNIRLCVLHTASVFSQSCKANSQQLELIYKLWEFYCLPSQVNFGVEEARESSQGSALCVREKRSSGGDFVPTKEMKSLFDI